MKVLDPGHLFALQALDGKWPTLLRCVKRNQPPEKYPGNRDAYPGTNCQEVIRALISRLKYLDQQQPARQNDDAIFHLEMVLLALEDRAHQKHGSEVIADLSIDEVLAATPCPTCGHVLCSWCPKTEAPGHAAEVSPSAS